MDDRGHQSYQYGILYPQHTHGVGSTSDLSAFFEAVELVSKHPELDYPQTFALFWKPIFGEDMLTLFKEMADLRSRFEAVTFTREILEDLNLTEKETKLKTDAADLAGVFGRVFDILADEAPEYIQLSKQYPNMKLLERGSVRLGPIEPIWVPFQFYKLPASAFYEQYPPLWLREEIFDQDFYKDKV